MKRIFKKLKLIDSFITNLPLSKQDFVERLSAITEDGNPGFSFSGIGIISQNISKHVIFTHGDKIYEFVYVVDKEKHSESQYNHMVESIKFLT